MTAMHDFDAIWGPGSLVIKVDGVVQMSAPTAQVRADYAHGGCNYTLGAQMAMQATSYDKTPDNWIEIANMWWSATDGTTQPVTKSLSISAPTGLVAGSNATLSITSNYAVSQNVTVTLGSSSYSLPVTGSGTSYTVTIPAAYIVAGTYQVQVIDGSTQSKRNQRDVWLIEPVWSAADRYLDLYGFDPDARSLRVSVRGRRHTLPDRRQICRRSPRHLSGRYAQPDLRLSGCAFLGQPYRHLLHQRRAEHDFGHRHIHSAVTSKPLRHAIEEPNADNAPLPAAVFR